MKFLPKAVLGVYLLLLIWLVLFKFSLNLSTVIDHHVRSLNLIPFAASERGSLPQIIYNLIVFIPFGLFLSVTVKRLNFWQKLTIIFLSSLTFEILQFIFAIGRSDMTDIVINTFGGFIGLKLYQLSQKYIDTQKLDQFVTVAGAIALLVLIMLLSLLFTHGLRFQSPHS